MKYRRRILAALAATGGMAVCCAQAQSSVQLYGAVDAFAGLTRLSGDTHSASVVNSAGLTTSYWGMGGQEALGGGLNALFALESFFRTDTGQVGRFDGDSMFGRNVYVGLNGAFGTVRFGRNATPWFVSMLLFNPLADSETFSPMFLHTYTTPPGAPVGHSVAGDNIWNNSVVYQSPGFGGLRFNAIYAFGEVAGHQGKQSYGGNLTYFNGDFGATLAVQRVAVNAPDFAASGANYQMAYLAGASYDFKIVKLFGQFAQTDNEFNTLTGQRNRTMQVGASVVIGPGTLMAEWARTWQGGNEALQSVRRDTTSLVYDYPFSKRSDIYAAWRYDKVTALNPGNTFGVGLRHKF
ncbi:porin transmembrane protein (plasmid) [Cupriavidus necator N-1]|uniref:Porin transmembrane protein n=1 Tax=Cupriavidus necator (strain ATCC 43291 / DSM 13513 / CCUG 52238 / LMG 8453 / N-1) TaxID=1042878 RepID=F8GVQ3_CUPNN|nr:porin [Cupriavidus necator]AEI82673.1 porin transmembrane protein [Cupriavidus necator N-1]MDX6007667.1 porin [Cupriavidus necator]